MKPYDESEVDSTYADRNLRDTLVMYEGEVCVVKGLQRVGGRLYCLLGNVYNQSKGVSAPLSKVDITPTVLGYANYNKNCYYLVRKPLRGLYKQGLHYGNIVCVDAYSTLSCSEIPLPIIANSILGKYPSYKTVLDNCANKRKNCEAWNNNWALNSHGKVFYKGMDNVGTIVGGLISLKDEYKYLDKFIDYSSSTRGHENEVP